MSTSHEPPAALTLERVLALEQQVRELRLGAPTARAPATGPTEDPTADPGLAPVPERRRHDRRRPGPLEVLSPREHEVLELMAHGCSNTGVARRLHLSERTVEATTAHVFRKLGLEPSPLTNRRVLAVLTLLRARAGTDRAPGPPPGAVAVHEGQDPRPASTSPSTRAPSSNRAGSGPA